MFNVIRLFSIVSLILFSALTIAGGMYLHGRAVEDMTRLVGKNNASLVRGYGSEVWKRYRDTLAPLLANPAALKGNPVVTGFAQDTVRYFQGMPLLRVNIYSAAGQLVMSDNVNGAKKLATSPSSPDAPFVAGNYKRSVPISQLLTGIALQGAAHGKLVQTVTPLADGGNTPDGAIEILVDVTDQLDELRTVQLIGTGAVICMVLFPLFVLLLSSRRAENIIARQHEANAELIDAAAAAVAENREKSQFLANISHELRTPLNAIIGFSDIIQKETPPQAENPKFGDYISDIHSSGVHLLSLINDILDYSKAEAGKLALEVSEVNVSKLIQNSMRLLEPRAESANVRLLEQLPKDQIIMLIDSKKFKQVLLNLLSNAVKFTPAGGQVMITAWQNLSDDTYSFEVEDTGIGIAPKDISRAMAPFGQVDNTLKRKYEGTGLGLPLTKKFVELMGGKFKIESELNKGTKITFTMPRELKEREGITVKQAS